MLLLIDNYDSFVYNLAHYFEQEGQEVLVIRNDGISLDEVEKLNPEFIVVSPGPCTPDQAGISVDLIRRFAPSTPILGVCLGHQCIARAFGARVVRAKAPWHGKTSEIRHHAQGLFAGMEQPLTVARYHSLVVEEKSLPECLEVTAFTPEGEIMALRHKVHRVLGVQFHPESIMTRRGRRICRNFLAGGREVMELKKAIGLALAGRSLDADAAGQVMEEIMSGEASPARIAAWLIAMRQKGETPEEIAGCARTMRRFARAFAAPAGVVLDTCGTGGDNAHTFNISTLAAFVAAGAGLPVAKHGNRAVSSLCGSADLLEELGARIDCPVERMEKALRETGFAFAFAPIFHGAMKHAAGVRREIGVRTLFNMLGPLTNPAGARHQLIGVFERRLTRFFAETLALLGSERAMIVHGEDGLDEITLTGKTHVAELRGGKITEYRIDPTEYGLKLCGPEDLKGASPRENKRIALEILRGGQGPKRAIVLLNAGAAIYLGGVAEDLGDGIARAARSIDSGSAEDVLKRFIGITLGREHS